MGFLLFLIKIVGKREEINITIDENSTKPLRIGGKLEG